ncbi:hypothetical protein GCK32_009962 [Trichostrongylus colubriformis]|uniref:Uncharacterized protein n=1 Tax=Trichostrongylus colubriformis TaxID=6319 RepID=A0AAN8ILE3_TRICO
MQHKNRGLQIKYGILHYLTFILPDPCFRSVLHREHFSRYISNYKTLFIPYMMDHYKPDFPFDDNETIWELSARIQRTPDVFVLTALSLFFIVFIISCVIVYCLERRKEKLNKLQQEVGRNGKKNENEAVAASWEKTLSHNSKT